MPGRQVKNWGRYHKMRKAGMSKGKAARLTNWMAGRKRRAKKR